MRTYTLTTSEDLHAYNVFSYYENVAVKRKFYPKKGTGLIDENV